MTNTAIRKYPFIITGILLITLEFGGCDIVPAAGSSLRSGLLRIVTWNVQTLFDGDEGGGEYEEYRTAAGWTGEKYTARLIMISQAIDQLAEDSPDILILQEIENPRILEDLAGGRLSKQGYQWTFFGGNPDGSLGIGVLSRFPLIQTRLHAVTHINETAPRPVLEIWLQPEDVPLVLFACHWKSKLGGNDATEPLRRASARILLRRVREIGDADPRMPIIIMGDLNENHDEFYRNGSIISALLPDDPGAAELAGLTQTDFTGPDFLVLSGEKPPEPEFFDPKIPAFYSPWGRELQKGSYYYKNEWETIDHFLLTGALFDRAGWDFETSLLMDGKPFVNDRGIPDAYNPRTGQGLSDHLPLMLVLTNHGGGLPETGSQEDKPPAIPNSKR
jgi:endonuclease/exonuclease/phosphatase family metal-dependent hydrolase